jgi:hypothetical protein
MALSALCGIYPKGIAWDASLLLFLVRHSKLELTLIDIALQVIYQSLPHRLLTLSDYGSHFAQASNVADRLVACDSGFCCWGCACDASGDGACCADQIYVPGQQHAQALLSALFYGNIQVVVSRQAQLFLSRQAMNVF